MSRQLSLKLKDAVYEEVEEVVRATRTPRNAYINEALAFYTKLSKRKLRKKRLQKESRMVADSSLEVLDEFERIEDDLP